MKNLNGKYCVVTGDGKGIAKHFLEEDAAVVTFLCTDDASWISGQTIVASGAGLCL